MGWEQRHDGRWYLYRNRRLNGKPVKEYLAAAGDWGTVMAYDLERLQRRQRKVRKLTRKARARVAGRTDALLADMIGANADLKFVVAGLLCSFGFHQHKRGEWRMRREMNNLKSLIGALQKADDGPKPMIRYTAPKDDAEAVEVFAQARTGDKAAVERVQALVRSRNWGNWLGDTGRESTRQLIRKAAGEDPVWEAGINEKAEAMRRELLGDNPSLLDQLLARRVVNSWVAVYALELELTVRTPTDSRSRECLDRALSRAQKRMTDAARELARIRKLQLPAVLAQVNVLAARATVNAAAPR